jgi:hypothetical protein
LDEWRHAGAKVDDNAWTSLCGRRTGNLRRAWRHMNLVPLACLLEHPSWRLCRLGGGGRGSLAQWRWSGRVGRPRHGGQGRSQESNIGGHKKIYFHVHLGRRKNERGSQKTTCLAAECRQLVGRRHLLMTSSSNAASDVWMSCLRFLLILCCCCALCDAARDESVRCVRSR